MSSKVFFVFLFINNDTPIKPFVIKNNQIDEQQTCEPVQRIVFLKTHKTGSETIAGILRRYALLNGLSALLSTANINIHGGHLYSKDGQNKYDPVNEGIKMLGYGLPGAHFELIANHMTWNKSFVDGQVFQFLIRTL